MTKGQGRGSAHHFKPLECDPVVDALQAAIAESKLSDVDIAVAAMCSWGTVNKIRAGVTRRPHNWTVERIFEATGFQRKVVKKQKRTKQD